jgi:hypothetical protein
MTKDESRSLDHDEGNAPARSSGRDGTSRSATEQDLKATADAIRADVERLKDIETRKEQLPPDDPRVDELSHAAVSIADRLSQETRAERELSEELG